MLKWAKTIDWLAINSSALVLLIGLQLLSAFSPQPIESPNHQSESKTTYQSQETKSGFNWGFWEAFFTGVIAIWAIRQYGEMKRSSERELRAYVFIDKVEFAVPATPNGQNEPWYIHVIVKNFGQTPAYFAIAKSEQAIGAERPKDELIGFSADAITHPEAVLPPGHFHTVRIKGLDNGITDFTANRTAGNKGYVWGRIDYMDAFGNFRWLTFQMISHFGQVAQFGYCEKGNGTDDTADSMRGWV